MFALHCTGWQVAGESVICECSVSETREGSPLVQLKQPATQILTALVLQQRRWARPLGTAHFSHSQVSVDTSICHDPSHKICNSICEMNATFQFDLARSCGHSRVAITEGCSNQESMPFDRFCTVECQSRDRLGFAKFQFQLLLSNFAFCSHALNMANLFVLERTQTQTPSLGIYHALSQIRMSTKIQAPGR